jgi:hypothetical protein
MLSSHLRIGLHKATSQPQVVTEILNAIHNFPSIHFTNNSVRSFPALLCYVAHHYGLQPLFTNTIRSVNVTDHKSHAARTQYDLQKLFKKLFDNDPPPTCVKVARLRGKFGAEGTVQNAEKECSENLAA